MLRKFTLLFLPCFCSVFFAILLIISGVAIAQKAITDFEPGVLLVRDKTTVAGLNRLLSDKRIASLLGTMEVKDCFPHLSNTSHATALLLTQWKELHFSTKLSPLQVASVLRKFLPAAIMEPLFWPEPLSAPNDPSVGSQGYLRLVKAYEGWDIHKGDTNTIMAIVDSGIDIDHPDLVGNIALNYNDPIDGIDNDNDGYTDNFRGWDLAGGDFNNVVGDRDPGIYTGGAGHGTHVAGIAGATTNNGVGVAGLGNRCRILPIKTASDNTTTFNRAYYGIAYAADHKASVINCSFAQGTYSQLAQDVINYATLAKGCLVIAGAGNTSNNSPVYPANCDNAMSIAALRQDDTWASFSSFGPWVDAATPGESIYNTIFDNSFDFRSGSSQAAPVATGIAAVVRSKMPWLKPRQVESLLRISSQNIYAPTKNWGFLVSNLGSGRLDMQKALTYRGASLRMQSWLNIQADNGSEIFGGDSISLRIVWKNELWRSRAPITIKIGLPNNQFFNVLKEYQVQSIDSGEQFENSADLFKYKMPNLDIASYPYYFKIEYSDSTGMADFEYLAINLNPNSYNYSAQNLATTVVNDMRMGYQSLTSGLGLGFSYKQRRLLYELGLVVGRNKDTVVNNLRTAGSATKTDWRSSRKIKIIPADGWRDRIVESYANDSAAATPLGLEARHRLWASIASADSNFLISEYHLFGKGRSRYDSLHLAIFADWDASPNGPNDQVGFDTAQNFYYVSDKLNMFVGMASLSDSLPNCFAVANDGTDSPFGIFDGFTQQEKFQMVSSGLFNLNLGQNRATGTDIAVAFGKAQSVLQRGDSIRLAVALVVGRNRAELGQTVAKARAHYRGRIVNVEGTKLLSNTLVIYPNPASKTVFLSAKVPLGLIKVLNTAGKELLSYDTRSNSTQVSVGTLPKGIYLVSTGAGSTRLAVQ